MNSARSIPRRSLLPLIVILLASAASVPASAAPEPTPRAAERLQALRAAFGPKARVDWPEKAPRPKALRLLDEPTTGETPAARVQDFLTRRAALLRVEGLTLRPQKVEHTRRAVVVRLQQEHDGVPVYQRGATVVLDGSGQRVRSVTLHTADVTLPDTGEDIGPEAAVAAAREQARAVVLEGARPTAAKRILAGPPDQVVYQVVLPTIAPAGRTSVFVDAATGALVWQRHDAIR